MFTQKFIKIFHSVQEIGLFSLFQNLALGKASTNDSCHFAISRTRCRQYQCVCKILSKYSKRFKSYRQFSRTGREQNLHKLSGDKIKCLIIGHSMKVNLQFQLTFFGSCNNSKRDIHVKRLGYPLKQQISDWNQRRRQEGPSNAIEVQFFVCTF